MHYVTPCGRVITSAQGGGTLVDCVRIWVSSGNGAAGEPAYGGKGGRGGNVYVRADSRVGDGTRGLGRIAKENPALRFLAQNGFPSRYTIYTVAKTVLRKESIIKKMVQ